MSIIFDLDGTLLDASKRMYLLFCELVPDCTLTKKEYWDYKRNQVSHKILLEWKYPQADFADFNERWMELIESERYLNIDTVYPDTIETLEKLRQRTTLYLLTARQRKDRLLNELRRLNIEKYFKKILATERNYSKEELLQRNPLAVTDISNKKNYFVSDMGKDIALGNQIGYRTVAITHGFMNRERLQDYNPKAIIDELKELLMICEG